MSSDPPETPMHSGDTEGSDSKEKSIGEETTERSDSQEKPTAIGSGDPQPLELPPETTSQATTSSATTTRRVKLILNPDRDLTPDTYDDPELEYTSEILSQLEMHLPTELLTVNKDEKATIMSDILGKYICREDCVKRKKLNRYKRKIKSRFQRSYYGLYDFQATDYIDPSFLEAIRKKEVESFKGIIKPSSGIYVFQLLTPIICDVLLEEVEDFRKWATESNIKLREATNVHKDSVVLDDIGLDGALNDLINHCVCPLVQEFFPEMRGENFDSHHGFIVEYTAENKNALVSYTDDSEVILNVCLSDKQSVGGEVYFLGTRCVKHETTDPKPKEMFEYRLKAGEAVLHHSRNRFGTKVITSGQRTNMILWCKSFARREKRTTYYKEIDSALWCCECEEEARGKEKQRLAARKDEVVIKVEPAEQAQVNTPQLTTGDQPANP